MYLEALNGDCAFTAARAAISRFTDISERTIRLLCRTLHNIKENEKQGPIHCIALRERLGWDEDTFYRILEVAKRDRAVYEPRPGYLAVIQ